MSAANRPAVVAFAERVFVLLQALYPRSFLREFENQMADVQG